MGIKQLMKVIGDEAPDAIKKKPSSSLFGRVIAIDASMSLYQFLIATQLAGHAALSAADGSNTAHLTGVLYRSVKLAEAGIKLVWVFDGRAPEEKQVLLAKRREAAAGAAEALATATVEGNAEAAEMAGKRAVRVSREQSAEAAKLAALMGLPVIEAPGEAEATAAALAAAGKAYGVGSEDMDTLTLGAPVLVRQLTGSDREKGQVTEINLARVLAGLDFTMEQFIDLCILLGCDYLDTIRGIGPKKAVEAIRKHKTIEGVLASLDKDKYTVPTNWDFERTRQLFKAPVVSDIATTELKWKDPDEEGMVAFLCGEKGFDEERVRKQAARLRATKKLASQGRLTSFFGPPVTTKTTTTAGSKKRAAASAKGKGGSAKKGKPRR
jgi:flap endonuclease-1